MSTSRGYGATSGSAGLLRQLFLVANVVTVGVVLLTLWNAVQWDRWGSTYWQPPTSPGVETSLQLEALWWFQQINMIGLLLLPLATALRIAVPPRYLTFVAQLIVAFVYFAFLVVFAIVLGVEAGDCNTVDPQSNACTDQRWCCINSPVVPAAPVPGCPYLDACVPLPVPSDLEWDGAFMWAFWLTIVMAVLALAHGILGCLLPRKYADGGCPERKIDACRPVSPQQMQSNGASVTLDDDNDTMFDDDLTLAKIGSYMGSYWARGKRVLSSTGTYTSSSLVAGHETHPIFDSNTFSESDSTSVPDNDLVLRSSKHHVW